MADNLQSLYINIDPDLTENILRYTIGGVCFLLSNRLVTISGSFIGDTMPCDDMTYICAIFSKLGLQLTDMSLAVCVGFMQ